MLETSSVTEHLRAARAYADAIGLRMQLETRLTYLDTFASPKHTRCVLSPHPLPHSFSFVVELETQRGEWTPWFEGALVYHGAHDHYGAFVYPTLPVPAAKSIGWTIYR